MAEPIPVVLCGAKTEIAAVVIEALKPEYDTVHLILSPDAGQVEIPLLLRGEAAASDNDLGSKNYANPPRAVLLGAGYDDDAVAAMRKAAADAQAPNVPWLRPDPTVPTPPLGYEYGKALVIRLKELMGKLNAEGKLNAGTEGVFLF